MAKTKAWGKLTYSDTLHRHIAQAWEDRDPSCSTPYATLARFLRQPEGPFFSSYSRVWREQFLDLQQRVAIKRMESL